MSRIFLSHSSVDELEAVALKHWLARNGWDDVFLDVDPERGLVAGERWQEALKRAADRCEAVIFVVSPAWAKSKWCLAEFLLAKNLNKRIFGVVLKDVPVGELPTEMTAEWQLCHLVGQGPTETVSYRHRNQSIEISFHAEGLRRLESGLKKAGLQADFFPWPPKNEPERAPYRGLEPLDSADAAVLFGRDVEILQGLDKLRGMRASDAETLFIILGASGAGKSSFLRAGLLPRLARDDRHFFPLKPIRPELSPIFGERGLAQVIYEANARLNLLPSTLGDVKSALGEGIERVTSLLCNIQNAARARQIDLPVNAPPPTLVLSVDQAEELFNVDSLTSDHQARTARTFLELIGALLRDNQVGAKLGTFAPIIVAFTIRSDRYEPLQTAPELAGLKSVVFDALKPMPRAQFKEVITGPALRATESGSNLKLHPDLVNRLLGDCDQGGDTLPLLSLTLARLYRDYGSDGYLSLDEYDRMGGMADVIKDEAESILSTDPETRHLQLECLHDAFIPALVTINPVNDQPMRRLAAMSDLSPGSRPLVRALVDKHLLLSDLREDEPVVEVAHESLFRQWNVLIDWLREERTDLKNVDQLEQAVSAWLSNGRKAAWLMQGERLEIVEVLAAKPRYSRRLEGAREFLLASHRHEAQLREDESQLREDRVSAEIALRQEAEERQRTAVKLVEVEVRERAAAELTASRLQRQARKLTAAIVGVVIALAFSALGFWHARSEQVTAEAALRQTNGLRIASQGTAMLDGTRPGGDVRALLQLVAASRIARHAEVDAALLAAMVARITVNKIWLARERVLAVAFSPDGSRIASGSASEFQLWDVKTGQLIGPLLPGHKEKELKDFVSSVAFSPDGNRVVSGGWDKKLHLWDAKTGQSIGELLQEAKGTVHSIAFSPDGSRIASGSGSALQLWDAKTGQPIGEPLQRYEGEIYSVAFSPYSDRIASGSDSLIQLWDAKTGKRIGKPMSGHKDRVSSISFSPNGERIVSGSEDTTLRLWDAKTGQSLGVPLQGHEKGVSSVAFSSDGSRIVSGGGWDKTIRLWDATTGQQIGKPLSGHKNFVSSVAFSPDGSRIVSGSWDHTLWLQDVKTDQAIDLPLLGHREGVVSVAFSPDGHRIVSGSRDHTLRLWDAKTGQSLGVQMLGHEKDVTSVAFSPDGRHIVSGSWDHTLILWDTTTGRPIGAPLQGHEEKVSSVAFSPDGGRIVSGSRDQTLILWNATTGRPIGAPLHGHEEEVSSVAFSPDGRRIVSGSWDHTLRLWDATTGQPIGAPLQGHEDGVTSVSFNQDGSQIVSGSFDKKLLLWDAKTGRTIGEPLRGSEGEVLSVAFSPDGSRIISGNRDTTLQFWDATSGQPIGTPLRGHKSFVQSVAFSPDGNSIVSGSDDRTLRLWPAPNVWPDKLCAKLTRNMSLQEWHDWVSPNIDYVCQCVGLPIPPDISSPDVEEEMCTADKQ